MSFFSSLLRNISGGHHGQTRHGSLDRPNHQGSRHDAPRQGNGDACWTCRAALPSGARFCAECGTATAARLCGSCTAPLPAGARFCAGCGTTIAGARSAQ